MMKKRLVRAWMTEDTYHHCKVNAAKAGVPIYEFFDMTLKKVSEEEDSILRRRYYPKF